MKMPTVLIIGCIMTFILIVTGCHHRSVRSHANLHDSEKLTDHIVSKLDLNTPQQTLLKGIIDDLLEAKKNVDDRSELRKILVLQLKSEKLDEELLRQETERILREAERTAENFISGIGAFHASLNTDQRQRLSILIAKERNNRRLHH